MKRLPQAGHVAVTEDSPHPGKKREFLAVAFDILLFEKSRNRLPHGDSFSFH